MPVLTLRAAAPLLPWYRARADAQDVPLCTSPGPSGISFSPKRC